MEIIHRNDPDLREYQSEVKSRLFAEWEHHRHVMVQMPTGTGKTHVLAAVVKEFLNEEATAGASQLRTDSMIRGKEEINHKSESVWVIAHRRELVAQIKDIIRKMFANPVDESHSHQTQDNDRLIAGVDSSFFIPHSSFIKVMSIQWLARNWPAIEEQPELIIIDEAHHALADSYRELWRHYPEVKILGMTATPCRLNLRGFTELFDVLVTSWSISEFITRGYLSPFDYVSIRTCSREQRLIQSLRKRGADGDYQVKEMNEVLNRQPSIQLLYEGIQRYAPGKRGIVYAISIEHARCIADYYNRHGVDAVAIDSRTPSGERLRLVEEFRQGRIRVLVNVDVFSEGFDCPDVEFVQLARPTLSLSKYLQQVGRGLRRSPGKESCLLLDHVGLYRIFGLPNRDRDWQAMFEGRLLSRTSALLHKRNASASLTVAEAPADLQDELEVVVTHEELSAQLQKETNMHPKEDPRTFTLLPHYDRQQGLWGLKRGETQVVTARYTEVIDTSEDLAAVRLPNGQTAVVDEHGEVRWTFAPYRKLKFLKDQFLLVTEGGAKASYCLDLKNGHRYRERPNVLHYGHVELLQSGTAYFSRTRKVYANLQGPSIDSLHWNGFALRIPDANIPLDCRSVCQQGYEFYRDFACLLEGDDESAYWYSGHLADGSLIVMDDAGRYYHVEQGRPKHYIARNDAGSPEECFDQVIPRLQKEAIHRFHLLNEKRIHEQDQKRQKRLESIRAAYPFRMGQKWGLKLGEQIVVAPKYRTIRPPVGDYCAYEDNPCQWGVMALDGRVLVEARYMDVSIERNGTVHLTVIPGKVKTVKL